MARRPGADDGPDPVLSGRQLQILDFIKAYAERHGVSPSYREIGNAVGLKSSSTVKYQVEQLQEKRCLVRRDRMPRTIMAKSPRLRSISQGLLRFQQIRARKKRLACRFSSRWRPEAWRTPILSLSAPSGYLGTWSVPETCSRSR